MAARNIEHKRGILTFCNYTQRERFETGGANTKKRGGLHFLVLPLASEGRLLYIKSNRRSLNKRKGKAYASGKVMNSSNCQDWSKESEHPQDFIGASAGTQEAARHVRQWHCKNL